VRAHMGDVTTAYQPHDLATKKRAQTPTANTLTTTLHSLLLATPTAHNAPATGRRKCVRTCAKV
jgi:hypothetical protein